MEIKLISSTGNMKTKEELIRFGRDAARICYSQYDFEELQKETDEENRLSNSLLEKGHQSPYEQAHLAFYFVGIPKFGAMLLNNEKTYVTSEKSGRYTIMKGPQEELYRRWLPVFDELIEKRYPKIPNKTRGNLARENARYLNDVFTPTRMLHTLSFRQLNYIMHFFRQYIEEVPDTDFTKRTKNFMKEFVTKLSPFDEPRLRPQDKRRRLSMFAKRDWFAREFGENYSIEYPLSFAAFADSQRHRTLKYEIQTPEHVSDESHIFIPPILQDYDKLVQLWTSDMLKVAETDFPQGQLLQVHETGHYEDFLSKATERLCGRVQLEVMQRVKQTLHEYMDATRHTNPNVHSELVEHARGPKCALPWITCKEPCTFGKKGLERLI